MSISLFVQNYLAAHANAINTYAQRTGVPATAIAAAVAEEMRHGIAGEIFICEEAHRSRRARINLLRSQHIACISQASRDVFVA